MSDSRLTNLESVEQCPNCHSFEIERERVDVGIGTLNGPRRCEACGWHEPTRGYDPLEDDDWILDPDMEAQ